MNKRRTWFYISLAIMLFTIVLLVTGSSILTIALDKHDSIPLGTFITWAGIISLPLTIYWGIKEFRKPTRPFYKYLAVALKSIMILAVLWVPISYLLSGNISFSFAEKDTFQGGQLAMKWFWGISYGMALGPILLLIVYWLSLLFNRNHNILND